MSARGLAILAAVTAIVAVMAWFGAARQRPAPAARAEPAPVAPGLAARVNDAAAIEIESGDRSLRVVRHGEGWGVEEFGGYPAKFEKVKETIVGIANLRVTEPRTARPEQYERLGVQDPEPGAPSSLVNIRDGTGAALASVIVGRQAPAPAPNRTAYYVRRAGEAQSWLAEGKISVTADPLQWVERQVLNIDAARVRSVLIEHPGGPDAPSLEIERPSADVRAFTIVNLPEGREPASGNPANQVASAVSFLSLEDVRAADAFEWDAQGAVRAEYRTFDGLVVRVESVEREGRVWARFAAEAETIETTDEDPEGTGGAAEARREAESINDRVRPWVFAVQTHKALQFRRRIEDLLGPILEPAPGTDDEDPAPWPGDEAGEPGVPVPAPWENPRG